MLVAKAKISEESMIKASYADLECLIQLVRNLLLIIDKVTSYLKSYESSTKKLFTVYIKAKR